MAKVKAEAYLDRKRAKMYLSADIWQGRLARLLVILLMCVLPVYLNRQRYIELTGNKFWFFFVCMCFILFCTLVIWAFRLLSKPRLLPQDRLSVADWAVLGFAAVTLLSALMSPFKEYANVWIGIPEPDGRYDGAVTQLLFVAAFLIVSRWYKPRESDFVIFGFSAMIVSLIGILQFYGMDFLSLWPNHIPRYYVENFYNIFFRSTLGNINIVSTYVCVALLLCGFLYIKVNSKWRFLWLTASALTFWMMILADSFSGMVGTAGATVLSIPFVVENRKVLGRFLILGSSWVAALIAQWLFFDVQVLGVRTAQSLLPYAALLLILLAAGLLLLKFGKEPGPDAPVKWKRGVIVLAAVIIVGLIGLEVVGKQAADAGGGGVIYEARELLLRGNFQDTFGTNRIFIWRNALSVFPQTSITLPVSNDDFQYIEVFRKNPIIGTGPDTFAYSFPIEAQGFYGETYDKAHNEYIQILICQGILGLLCYLVFLGGVFIKAIPNVFKNPILMAVVVAFIGYCVQAFFNISLPIASQILWIFAGMMVNKNFSYKKGLGTRD